jgi:predicted PurR-regulated permease PerM
MRKAKLYYMSNPMEQRRNITIAIVVITGLVIGLFIKRIPLGLLIGVVLGLLASGLVPKGK